MIQSCLSLFENRGYGYGTTPLPFSLLLANDSARNFLFRCRWLSAFGSSSTLLQHAFFVLVEHYWRYFAGFVFERDGKQFF